LQYEIADTDAAAFELAAKQCVIATHFNPVQAED
jgi:hypothetical protein